MKGRHNQVRNVYITELVKPDDMNDPADYDFAFDLSKPSAHIEFQLRQLEGGEQRIESISITHSNLDTDSQFADPLSLIRLGFEFGFDESEMSSRKHFNIDWAFDVAKSYGRKDEYYWFRSIYESGNFSAYAENVWNDYCLFEGFSTMKRINFVGWIHSFSALAIDLIESPILNGDKWEKRAEILRIMAQNPQGTEGDCFHRPNWESLLSQLKWTPQVAHSARLRNACFAIERFQKEVPKGQPLESFLNRIVEAFIHHLCNSNQIKRCSFCSGYFLYDSRKLFCSMLSDGRECGKSARNRRNYLNRSEDQKERNRQGNRELRLFYKKHGIKKKQPD